MEAPTEIDYDKITIEKVGQNKFQITLDQYNLQVLHEFAKTMYGLSFCDTIKDKSWLDQVSREYIFSSTATEYPILAKSAFDSMTNISDALLAMHYCQYQHLKILQVN